jgi:hypothetical protein
MRYKGLARESLSHQDNYFVPDIGYKVRREVRMNDKTELYTVPTLTRYENPDIPEQFLVARGA